MFSFIAVNARKRAYVIVGNVIWTFAKERWNQLNDHISFVWRFFFPFFSCLHAIITIAYPQRNVRV